ncbi:MAG: endonuclease/exonuclease/phosphatase family protein [Chloroflexota bacterium]
MIDFSALSLVLTTLMGFLGRRWWIFDWFSHFRVQSFFLSALIGLIYIIGKNRWMTALMVVLALFNAGLILPLYSMPPHHQSGEPVYRILLANVLKENPNHAVLSNLIAESDPDFVMLIEVNQAWLDDLNLSALGYEHFIAETREDNFGIALYSRYDLVNSEIQRFGQLDTPSIVAHLKIDQQPVVFILSHPVPPKTKWMTLQRSIQMTDLMTYAGELDEIVLAAGDFNATSWSPYYKDWLQLSQLRDSRKGFGIQPTWPTDNWLLRVPIDHILVSPEINVQYRAVGPDIGSDHFPLIMDFSLSD